MACNCIEVVNEQLKPRNTVLHEPLLVIRNGAQDQSPCLFVETRQIETGRGKAKAVSMFASYCPFCGDKYGTGAA